MNCCYLYYFMTVAENKKTVYNLPAIIFNL